MKNNYSNPQILSLTEKMLILILCVIVSFSLSAYRIHKGNITYPHLSVENINEIPAPQPNIIQGRPPEDGEHGDPQSKMIVPNAEGFEKVSLAVSESVNLVNISRDNQEQVDPSDMHEKYDNFNRAKYEEVLSGQRHYKYLKLEKYWFHEEERIRAIVSVPNSEDGKYALEYVGMVLYGLKNNYGIDTSRINYQDIQQIARDIDEIGRFTCIKFLRLVWAVFSDGGNDTKGLFPQVYQMQIVDAGDLASKVDGGFDLFNPNNSNVIMSSLVKYANISNSNPDERIDLFDNKVVVFFRPTDKITSATDNGHVGVGRLKAHYDEAGNFSNFTISFVEVMGTTGQSFYHDEVSLDEFRSHLYFNTHSSDPNGKQIVGWFFNR